MHCPHYQLRLGFGLVALLLATAASDAAAATHEFLNYVDSDYAAPAAPVPSLLAGWQEAPTVVVCDEAPISVQVLQKATDWWASLGHPFQQLRYKEPEPSGGRISPCSLNEPVGSIVIRRLSPQEWLAADSRAKTLVSVSDHSGEIQWARIALQDDVAPRVLEHELGHALGYLHVDQPSHLMHSSYASSGWGLSGLSLAERASLVVTSPSTMLESVAQADALRLGRWKHLRGVILCADVPVPTRAVKRSMSWWHARGHNLRPLILPTDSRAEAVCSDVWGADPTGYVVLTQMMTPAEEIRYAAVAHFHWGARNRILWVKVFLRAENSEQVIAHELGHALGFAHLDQVGHLMYPQVQGDDGWGDEGLVNESGKANYRSSAE